MGPPEVRERFAARLQEQRDDVVRLCRRLIQIDSQNPPGDTTALVEVVEALLAETPGSEMRRIVAKEPIVNLIASVRGAAAGRRLVFNGHLDTFPIGSSQAWSVDPLGGEVRDGRIYGRGACDMKAGLAASVMAFLTLCEFREAWSGEVVLALVGDEETGGVWGTQHLLANVPEVIGDAMLNGDAGSPRVARVGEKGNLWVELSAAGTANHGAHVHLGRNAIERLLAALDAVLELRDLPSRLPPAIVEMIDAAEPVSELISGAGEAETLRRITVNIGRIEGGININTIPDQARAEVDIRLPPGTTTAAAIDRLSRALDPMEGIAWRVTSACEPNWTDPEHPLARIVRDNAATATDEPVAVNLRPGFSDARFFRLYDIPSVVYGCAPHNMGGPDEYATVDDLLTVFRVHALSAFDYLSQNN